MQHNRSGQNKESAGPDQSPELSVVVPVYNEEEVVRESYRRLSAVLEAMCDPALPGPAGSPPVNAPDAPKLLSPVESYELIFVNDGSKDATMEILMELAAADPKIRVVDFSRNFGHQAAISAGMDIARGDAVVVIDADLQDPPELIPAMLQSWREGWDVIYGKRISRKGETFFKKATASIFYRLLRRLTSVDIPADTGDFRLIDRAVVNVLSSLGEKNRFIRGLVSWAGFRQTALGYVRDERFAGTTKYPLSKMIRFALDAVTSFSHKPLKIAGWLGFLLSVGSFVYLAVVVIQRLIYADTAEPGWASIVAISLFFNGIILILLGVMGEYIGRIYDESKNRPLYIVRSVLDTRSIAAERRARTGRRSKDSAEDTNT